MGVEHRGQGAGLRQVPPGSAPPHMGGAKLCSALAALLLGEGTET